jgi:hypothetical protein
MALSNEEIVTDILAKREILKLQDNPEIYENTKYSSNPIEYDLSLFIKTGKHKPVHNRFDSRYLFVT